MDLFLGFMRPECVKFGFHNLDAALTKLNAGVKLEADEDNQGV